MELDGFGTKSANALVEAIQSKKTPELARFLIALGIPEVGVTVARDLANSFGTFDTIRSVSREELETVDGEGEPEVVGEVALPVALLLGCVLPALVEEWICRGVLFVALLRVTSVRNTIVVSALLFALMHGLEAYLVSVPHRFVAGLVFGYLRARTGSLVPCVIAHFVNNLLATLVD